MRWLWLLLLLASPAWARDYPGRCLYDPMLEGRDHILQPAEIEEAGRYHVICSSHNVWLSREIKAAHDVTILENVTLGGAKPSLAWWEVPDTTWDLVTAVTYYAQANAELGADWYLHRTDGSLIELWGQWVLNWTDRCPKGRYGLSRGKTLAEWAKDAFPRILRHPLTRSGYDGVIIDTADGAWWVNGWYAGFRGLDFNQDRVADDHVGYWYWWDAIQNRQPWEYQKYQAAARMIPSMRTALPRPGKLLFSGNPPMPYSSHQGNGRKIEDFGRNYPLSPWFRHHWEGWGQKAGVLEAEKYFLCPDSELVVILQAVMPEDWHYLKMRQWAAFLTGVSMLKDYTYVAVSVGHGDGSRSLYIPQEWEEWRARRPLGEMYWTPDPNHRGVARACRLFELWDGKLGTVVVDTLGGPDRWRAQLVRYHYAPDTQPQVPRRAS